MVTSTFHCFIPYNRAKGRGSNSKLTQNKPKNTRSSNFNIEKKKILWDDKISRNTRFAKKKYGIGWSIVLVT